MKMIVKGEGVGINCLEDLVKLALENTFMVDLYKKEKNILNLEGKALQDFKRYIFDNHYYPLLQDEMNKKFNYFNYGWDEPFIFSITP